MLPQYQEVQHAVVVVVTRSWCAKGHYKSVQLCGETDFSKHANMIMCDLFFALFTGYRSKAEYITNCQLSVTTSSLIHTVALILWRSHCVHPFQAASLFCRQTGTSHPPILTLTVKVKHLAKSISLTVVRSNGILSLLTFVTFGPRLLAKLR